MAVFGSLFAPGGNTKTRYTTTYKMPPTSSRSSTSGSTGLASFGAISNLVGSYNQAQGQAKSANEQRYQQLLGTADQDYQRSAGIREQQLKETGDVGGQLAADIESSGAAEEANVLRRLQKLGMSGTTIAPNLKSGVRKQTRENLNRLAFSLQGERRGIMDQQAAANQGTKLGIMERRTDAYPSMSNLTGLIEGAAGSGSLGALSGLSFGGAGGGTSGPLTAAQRAKSNAQFAASTGGRLVSQGGGVG